jgi:hypothetical protein
LSFERLHYEKKNSIYAGNKKNARIFLNGRTGIWRATLPSNFIEKGNLRPLKILVEAMSARQPA